MEKYSESVHQFLNKIFSTEENGFQAFYQALNRYITSTQITLPHQYNCQFCEISMSLPNDEQLTAEKMICINLLTERLPISTFGCVILWYYIKNMFDSVDEETVFKIDIWSIFKHFFVGDCKTIKQYNGYSASLVYEYLEVKSNMMKAKTNEDLKSKPLKETLTRLFDTAKFLYTHGPCHGYNVYEKTRCIYSNCGSYDNNIIYLSPLKPFVSTDYRPANIKHGNILVTKLTTGNVSDYCEVNLADSFQFQVKQDSQLPVINKDQHEVIIDKWSNIKKAHHIISSILQDDTPFSFLNGILGTCLLCSLSICDVFRICLEDFNCMCHDFLVQKNLLTDSLPVTVGLIKNEDLRSKSYSRLSALEAELKHNQNLQIQGEKKHTLNKKLDIGTGVLSFQLDRHTNIFTPFISRKIFDKWVAKYSLLHLDYFLTNPDFIYKHFVGSEHFFCVSNRRRVFYNSDDIFTKSHSCLLPFFMDLGCLLLKEKSCLSSALIKKILTSNIFNSARQHHIPEDYITHLTV